MLVENALLTTIITTWSRGRARSHATVQLFGCKLVVQLPFTVAQVKVLDIYSLCNSLPHDSTDGWSRLIHRNCHGKLFKPGCLRHRCYSTGSAVGRSVCWTWRSELTFGQNMPSIRAAEGT